MSTIDPLRIVPGSHRLEFSGLPVGKPGINETVDVVLQLRRKRPLHAHALLEAKLLLPRQVLEAQFGSDEDDVAAVIEFAHDNDLWVDKVERNKRLITLHGSVRVVERAFKVLLELRKHAGKTYRVRSGPIFVPPIQLRILLLECLVWTIDPQASPHLVRSKTFHKSF